MAFSLLGTDLSARGPSTQCRNIKGVRAKTWVPHGAGPAVPILIATDKDQGAGERAEITATTRHSLIGRARGRHKPISARSDTHRVLDHINVKRGPHRRCEVSHHVRYQVGGVDVCLDREVEG